MTGDERQIHVFQQLLEHLEVRYFALISSFETLRPLWKNRELEKQLIRQGKIWGAYVVGHTLLDASIIYCYSLLKDGNASNPTLKTLIRPFLPKNQAKNTGLLQRLACLFIESQMREHGAGWLSPAKKKMSALQREKNAERYRREFLQMIDTLAEDWALLEKASQKFGKYRGKWIAHFEVEYDEKMKKFRMPKLPTNRKFYATLSQIVRVVSRSFTDLHFVLTGVGTSAKFYQDDARRDAERYWGLRKDVWVRE